jgi:hypothetical protein
LFVGKSGPTFIKILLLGRQAVGAVAVENDFVTFHLEASGSHCIHTPRTSGESEKMSALFAQKKMMVMA